MDGWHASSRTAARGRVGTETGQTTAEYAVIIGFFALLVIAAVIVFRGGVSDLFERSGSETGAFRPPALPCDTRYAGGCVPPYPPDVDCADLEAIGITEVTLTSPDDPHGLDPDGDGVGCN